MNIMSTRTAPVGAMMSSVLARATAFGGGGRMTASATDTAPTPAAPAPAAPNIPADTAARLDAQDTQLADHEARIAGLEQRSPPPVGSAEETQSTSPTASAVAVAPVTRMVSSAEIYGRMNSL